MGPWDTGSSKLIRESGIMKSIEKGIRGSNFIMGRILAALSFALLLVCSSISLAQSAAEFGAAVNEQRLVNSASDPEVWLNYGRTYDEQRYSPLDQINKDTLPQLGLAWFADMTTSRGQEATPIVVDGALYISTSWSNVWAFNVRTGELRW
mgnify:FL=1